MRSWFKYQWPARVPDSVKIIPALLDGISIYLDSWRPILVQQAIYGVQNLLQHEQPLPSQSLTARHPFPHQFPATILMPGKGQSSGGIPAYK